MFASPRVVLSPSQYPLEGQTSRAPASRRVLEFISDDFLTELIKEPVCVNALLDLLFTKKEDLAGDLKVVEY